MNASELWRRWQAWAEELWPSTPAEKTQQEVARLDGELAARFARLVRLRQQIDACERRGDAEKVGRLTALYERQRQRLERRKRLRHDLAAGRVEVMDVTYPE